MEWAEADVAVVGVIGFMSPACAVGSARLKQQLDHLRRHSQWWPMSGKSLP
jgi:hypothetical protein